MATEKFLLYHYDPSFVAAAIFIVLFALSAVVQLYQLVRSRTWYMIPFLIGCICKVPRVRKVRYDEALTKLPSQSKL
jgi:hypothetical protein